MGAIRHLQTFMQRIPNALGFRRGMDFYNRKIILGGFEGKTAAEIFTKIHSINWWGERESVSGPGSTLQYTENIRKELPLLLQRFSIQSVFDAPCGDFNWMKEVVIPLNINYIGGDIVPALIEHHNTKYADSQTRFSIFNILEDPFPAADMWLCRDCLFHFSFKDAYKALENYCASNIPYILTSTHINDTGFLNTDIETGDFRNIDLFSAPFYFPKEVAHRIDDWIPPHSPRELCLWKREQIVELLPRIKSALDSM